MTRCSGCGRTSCGRECEPAVIANPTGREEQVLRIFLGWSGDRSRLLAEALADALPNMLQTCAPWMSTDIPKGERWSDAVGERLADYNVGLICVTPENVNSPWLLFEAGALSKALGRARVCPVLLGVEPADLIGPLAQFQATVVDREDLLRLVEALNGSLGEEQVATQVVRHAFSREWPRLRERIKKLAAEPVPLSADSIPEVIRSFARHGLPEPALARTANFEEGFETHAVYESACEIATRRLFIFGRKNRKLFDKEHAWFFQSLPERVQAGFDFRCLFLDPGAPADVLASAHQAADFPEELQRCVARAAQRCASEQLDPQWHLRYYRTARRHSVIIVDDAVLYTPMKTTADGTVRALTRTGFTVLNADAPLGKDLIEDFETVWGGASSFGGGAG